MVQLETNAINVLMLMTHDSEKYKNVVKSPSAKNLRFSVDIGTYGDASLSRGDLGNQLFQVVAAMTYAWKYNSVVVIETPTEENGIKIDCFSLEGLLIESGINISSSLKETNFCVSNYKSAMMFLATHFKENETVKLEGYFQNWRFAKMIEKKVRKCFSFKESYEAFANDIIKNIKFKFPNHAIIGVHYRSDDQSDSSGYHVGSEINHPSMTDEYYKKAIIEIENDLDTPAKYIIFSNNAAAAKKAFSNPEHIDKIIFAEDFKSKEDSHKRTDNDILSSFSAPVDLCILSKCDGHIISNSTFSWWGAWLANSENVVAPSRCRWFGEHLGKHNLTDLYPPSWKEIWFKPVQSSFITIENFMG